MRPYRVLLTPSSGIVKWRSLHSALSKQKESAVPHAVFNATCTVRTGPGASSPDTVLATGVPCRLVADPHFKDTQAPLSASQAYVTLEALAPAGPFITNTAPGVYTFDFTKADRLEVSTQPGVIWAVLRTELCDSPAPSYFRSSVAVEEPPGPSGCSLTYAEAYTWTDTIGVPVAHLVRTSSTTWSGDGWTLTAEVSGLDPDTCFSVWTCVSDEGTWEGTWNSGGPTLLYATPVPDGGRGLYVAV